MSIGVSRSVRVIHNRYETKLNSTQDLHPTFPRTPVISSWGEPEGERPRTTVLYIPCIWCSLNDQHNPQSVCVRLWVDSETSHLARSARPSNRNINIMQPKRRVNHVHHRTRPDGKQGRDEAAIHPSFFRRTFRSVQVLVTTSSCLDWTQFKQEFGSSDIPLSSSSPLRVSVHVHRIQTMRQVLIQHNTSYGSLFTLMTAIYSLNYRVIGKDGRDLKPL